MKALIGIDIGTQGTKAALFDEGGECLAQAFRPSRLHRPRPGVVEEDPERQFQSVCQTIRECVGTAKIDRWDVAGIGIDGQMAGILGVGRDGRHVTCYDSWLDTRCAPYITKIERWGGDQVLARTGCSPSFNHGPKKLWWKKERKRDYRRIAAFVQPGGYAVMRLCGLEADRAFIDTTYLHFSGLADNRRSRWDPQLCQLLGIDRAKLPRIVRPDAVQGELIPSVARRCGLPAGVPVVAGCGDTAASFLACGATAPGICVDVAGTASVFAATTSAFRADKRQRTLGCGQSAVPGLWHPYAYINGGGLNLEWFRRELANRGHSGRRGTLTLEELDRRAAANDPRRDGPLFVPHLGGRNSPPQPHLRGAWVGLSWDDSLGTLYRAVLEGVALEYAVYQAVVRRLYPRLRIRELRITGGGEQSDCWNTIKADALQLPVRRIERSEGAPLGSALVAGSGVGLWKSLSRAANRWVKRGSVTRPRKKMAALYAHRLAAYRQILESLDGILLDD